jgi:hypothetical protein
LIFPGFTLHLFYSENVCLDRNSAGKLPTDPDQVDGCLSAYSEFQIQDFILFKADGVPKSAQPAKLPIGQN